MQKYLLLFFLYLSCGGNNANAQGLMERVYVQTDRDHYSPGETIHFVAYAITETDTIAGTDLFAELWDGNFNKLGELFVPIIDGSASGSLTIPKEVNNTQVYFRAYTSLSSKQPIPFQFVKSVTGNDPGIKVENKTSPLFFPEGAKLVYNADNFIVYQMPPDLRGTIRNNKNEPIVDLLANEYGLGSFTMRPLPGETYSFHWVESGKEMVKALPVPVENGIALHTRQTADTLYFEIDNGGNKDLSIRKPKIHLLINNEIAYLVELNMLAKDKFSYYIPLTEFQPTLAELKVFDSENRELASRPLFVHRKSFDQKIELEIVKKDLDKRGENIFRIIFPDTLLRNVSVSITDADLSGTAAGSGIISAFFPPGSVVIPPIPGQNGFNSLLDLSLVASGIDNIAVPLTTTTSSISTNRYLQLSGVVKKGKKLVAGKEVLVGIRSAYTGKELYKVFTDEQGRFVLDGVIIYGEAFVHCRLPKSEDELTCEIELSKPIPDNDPAFFNSFKQAAANLKIEMAEAKVEQVQNDTIVFDEKSITLEEVVVKSDNNLATRKRLEDLEKKYVDGTAFGGYGATGETIDVINDPWSAKAFDLYSYIAQRMRSLTQRLVQGRRELFYFGRGTGGQTMITNFYLNNSRIDRDMLSGIRVDEIALIKFIPMLGSDPGLPPTIVIFLKKQGDQGYWEKDRYVLSEHTVNGYSISKDFMMPDYSNEQVKVQQDLRKTILWKPYLPVDKGVAELKFYNTDFARKLRIVLEGIAPDGSIIYFEKLIE
jgi:hypothetical protein